ncbi:MAG: hypothetical protein A2W25_12305 [candidate division Zixibacteria bacterium RBG_16_53_22]|nr:MAG: hypothetical protein A2W25_12305 [candidate division Zixibacteria bacterium RBG_16_53_22]
MKAEVESHPLEENLYHLSTFREQVMQRMPAILAHGGTWIDAVADVLVEYGYTLVSNEDYTAKQQVAILIEGGAEAGVYYDDACVEVHVLDYDVQDEEAEEEVNRRYAELEELGVISPERYH